MDCINRKWHSCRALDLERTGETDSSMVIDRVEKACFIMWLARRAGKQDKPRPAFVIDTGILWKSKHAFE